MSDLTDERVREIAGVDHALGMAFRETGERESEFWLEIAALAREVLALRERVAEAVAVAREAVGNCGCDGDPRCPLCDGLRARLAAIQEER